MLLDNMCPDVNAALGLDQSYGYVTVTIMVRIRRLSRVSGMSYALPLVFTGLALCKLLVYRP